VLTVLQKVPAWPRRDVLANIYHHACRRQGSDLSAMDG
jgi:hypothetical protein